MQALAAGELCGQIECSRKCAWKAASSLSTSRMRLRRRSQKCIGLVVSCQVSRDRWEAAMVVKQRLREKLTGALAPEHLSLVRRIRTCAARLGGVLGETS